MTNKELELIKNLKNLKNTITRMKDECINNGDKEMQKFQEGRISAINQTLKMLGVENIKPKKEIKIEGVKIGMGCTEILWSDREPYTVIEILAKNKIMVQADKAIRTDKNGASECQEYDFERNPNGTTYILTNSKKHGWHIAGTERVFVMDYREKYYDFSF